MRAPASPHPRTRPTVPLGCTTLRLRVWRRAHGRAQGPRGGHAPAGVGGRRWRRARPPPHHRWARACSRVCAGQKAYVHACMRVGDD